MSKRDIDTNVTTPGSVLYQRVFWPSGAPDGGSVTLPGPVLTVRRRRVLSLGRKLRFKNPEKAYRNSGFRSVAPTGRLLVPAGAKAHSYEGSSSGSLSGVHLDMAFPIYRGTGQRNAQILSDGSTLLNPDLLSQAQVKCLNKMRAKDGQATDFDVGVWFGERKETADLLRRGATGISDAAKAIARRDWCRTATAFNQAFGTAVSPAMERRRMRRVERWLKKEFGKIPSVAHWTCAQLNDAWLTYKLGLSPLLSDVDAALQRLKIGPTRESAFVRCSAQHSRTRDFRDQYSPVSDVRMELLAYELHGYTSTFVAAPTVTALNLLSRLGLTNPAYTTWQLTRASFVVDYWIAIGDFLKALNVSQEFEFIDGSYTQRIIRNTNLVVTSPGGRTMKGMTSLNHIQRTVVSSFPMLIPPLSFKGKDLSVSQAVTSSLLSLQFLKELYQKVPQLR